MVRGLFVAVDGPRGLPQERLTSDLYRPGVGAGRMLLCPRLTHPSFVVT